MTWGGFGGSTPGHEDVEADGASFTSGELDALDGVLERTLADEHLGHSRFALDAEVPGRHRTPQVGLEKQDARPNGRGRDRQSARHGALPVARCRRHDCHCPQIPIHVEVPDVRAEQSEDLGLGRRQFARVIGRILPLPQRRALGYHAEQRHAVNLLQIARIAEPTVEAL